MLRVYAPENIDLSIRRFVWLTTNLARKSGRFRKTGMSYDERTNGVFSDATREFVRSSISYKYPMHWHYYDFEKNYASQIMKRIRKRISSGDHRMHEGERMASMALLDEDAYFQAAHEYLKNILCGIRQKNRRGEDSAVGLHNAVPPFSVEQINNAIKYMPDLRVIITDRDPRDVFLNYPKDSYGRYLLATSDVMQKAKAFVQFYKSIRMNKIEVTAHPNILMLNFEDLCIHYSDYYKDILQFCEIDSKEHKYKETIFSPSDSIENIGMWHKCTGKLAKAVDYIEEELEAYLYAH